MRTGRASSVSCSCARPPFGRGTRAQRGCVCRLSTPAPPLPQPRAASSTCFPEPGEPPKGGSHGRTELLLTPLELLGALSDQGNASVPSLFAPRLLLNPRHDQLLHVAARAPRVATPTAFLLETHMPVAWNVPEHFGSQPARSSPRRARPAAPRSVPRSPASSSMRARPARHTFRSAFSSSVSGVLPDRLRTVGGRKRTQCPHDAYP